LYGTGSGAATSRAWSRAVRLRVQRALAVDAQIDDRAHAELA
jgi:hypothetical protein